MDRTTTEQEEVYMSTNTYDLKSKLAVRLACKFTDILFKHEDAITTSDAASALFDKLADALMELDENTLVDLVYDTTSKGA